MIQKIKILLVCLLEIFIENNCLFLFIEAEHEIFMLLKTFKVSCPVSYLNKKNESFFFIDENYQVFTPILGENLKEPNKVYIGRLLGNNYQFIKFTLNIY